MNYRAVFLALAAAALFGISTPAAKALLGSVSPAILAGLFYCGAGIGITMYRAASSQLPGRRRGGARSGEVQLARADLPWLAGSIAAGGIAGPLFLMAGLARSDASAASLLLTLEVVATALIAWLAFHENIGRRIVLGMALLIAGAMLLSWSGVPSLPSLLGPLAILGACVAWGLDNNLTRRISHADAMQIARLKGLVSGPLNLAIGLAAGQHLPPLSTSALAGLVGFFGYGVSMALFVAALRDLGSARTAAYFSTAPFVGAVAAVLALGEPVTGTLAGAGILMAIGVWLHVSERHDHTHEHGPMAHAHMHVHDAHHRHGHAAGDPPGEPHSHPHTHDRLVHRHRHVPDLHHRHRHQ